MSNPYMEDLGSEYEDAYDDAELYDDSEAFDDSEARPSRAERERRRRLLAAQRRRRDTARRRPSQSAPVALPANAPPRAVVSAVKELDLQGQVQQDRLRDAMAKMNRRQQQSNLATVLAVLVGQGLRVFGEPQNAFLTAAINTAPLALLPGSDRPGVGGLIRHPALYGGAGMLALTFIGEQRDSKSAVSSMNFVVPPTVHPGQKDQLIAEVFDNRNRPLNIEATWDSSNNSVINFIDRTTGTFQAGNEPGSAIITATAGGVSRKLRVDVVPAGYSTGASATAAPAPAATPAKKATP